MQKLHDEASIARLVSGLIIAGFHGTAANQLPLETLATYAGVILFARNAQTAAQTGALIRDIQEAVRSAGNAPALVAIDEEGGTVSRIGAFGVTMPSAMALGAAGDPGLTRDVYRTIGSQLAALGVTLDFAPDADTNTNAANPVIGVRAFGGQAAAVGRHVRSAIAGLHDAGVGATAKHFPGHGEATVDSHIGLPTIEADGARLRDVELAPFREAIDAGVDAVMTAHLSVPALDDSGIPATLSAPILTGLLRRELGFTGVIVTDCLQMDAIAGRYSPGDAAVRALEAGADLLAFASSAEAVNAAVRALTAAVQDGRLDARRIEESLERIDALRRRYASKNDRIGTSDLPDGLEAARRVARAAALRAVTVIRDPNGLLPLRLEAGRRLFVVQFQGGSATPVETTAKQTSVLGKMLARGSARVQEQTRSLDPAGHEYKQLLMAAGAADAVVAVTRRAWAHPLQAQAVADLHLLSGKPPIVIAAREPYDASVVASEATVIATYGDDLASLEAAAEVLLGEHVASGTVPVELAQAVTNRNAAP